MNSLKKYRKEIDKIDRTIIQLLEKRFSIVEKIGEFKRKFKLKIRDKKREKEMLEKRKKLIRKLNLSSDFIEKFFRLIIRESIKRMKNHNKNLFL